MLDYIESVERLLNVELDRFTQVWFRSDSVCIISHHTILVVRRWLLALLGLCPSSLLCAAQTIQKKFVDSTAEEIG